MATSSGSVKQPVTNQLDFTNQGLGELLNFVPDVMKVIKMGGEQAKTRDRIIDCINGMCDALKLAADLLSADISARISEFNRVRHDKEQVLRAYFERVGASFSEPALRSRLHEGQVCGELHKIGDRFTQPFSDETLSASSAWQAVLTFFKRSSAMSIAVQGLVYGEQNYIRDYVCILDDVCKATEAATAIPWNQRDILEKAGEQLVQKMRLARDIISEKALQIRRRGDRVIQELC